MNPHKLTTVIDSRWPAHSVASTHQLAQAELGDRVLTLGVRSGVLLRLRRGAYVRSPGLRNGRLANPRKDGPAPLERPGKGQFKRGRAVIAVSGVKRREVRDYRVPVAIFSMRRSGSAAPQRS